MHSDTRRMSRLAMIVGTVIFSQVSAKVEACELLVRVPDERALPHMELCQRKHPIHTRRRSCKGKRRV